MTATDEQIAQPGLAGTKAAMAFGGADTTVRIEGKPRRIKFDDLAKPPEVAKRDLQIPPSLRGVTPEISSIISYEEKAERYGEYWVRIQRSMLGPHGRPLEVADEVQVDGATALVLCSGEWTDSNGDRQPTAIFLNDQQTKEEIAWLKEAE